MLSVDARCRLLKFRPIVPKCLRAKRLSRSVTMGLSYLGSKRSPVRIWSPDFCREAAKIEQESRESSEETNSILGSTLCSLHDADSDNVVVHGVAMNEVAQMMDAVEPEAVSVQLRVRDGRTRCQGQVQVRGESLGHRNMD